MPPFLVGTTRYLIAGVLLYAWCLIRRFPKPTWIQWRSATIIGGLMLLGGNGGVVWAEQRVPSGIASVLIAMVPIFMAVLSRLFFAGSALRPRLIIGLLAGLGGVALLALRTGATSPSFRPIDLIVLLCAALSWSIGSLYSRKAELPASPFQATAMEMIGGGLLLAIVSASRGEWTADQFHAITASSWWAIAYLVGIGSLISLSAYVWLLQVEPPARVATYAYVNPVVALFLGWWVLNETLSLQSLVAALVIIGSVAIIIMPSKMFRGLRSAEARV